MHRAYYFKRGFGASIDSTTVVIASVNNSSQKLFLVGVAPTLRRGMHMVFHGVFSGASHAFPNGRKAIIYMTPHTGESCEVVL
jgi:hypothetical protein